MNVVFITFFGCVLLKLEALFEVGLRIYKFLLSILVVFFSFTILCFSGERMGGYFTSFSFAFVYCWIFRSFAVRFRLFALSVPMCMILSRGSS